LAASGSPLEAASSLPAHRMGIKKVCVLLLSGAAGIERASAEAGAVFSKCKVKKHPHLVGIHAAHILMCVSLFHLHRNNGIRERYIREREEDPYLCNTKRAPLHCTAHMCIKKQVTYCWRCSHAMQAIMTTAVTLASSSLYLGLSLAHGPELIKLYM
jgi:hypothetical protein